MGEYKSESTNAQSSSSSAGASAGVGGTWSGVPSSCVRGRYSRVRTFVPDSEARRPNRSIEWMSSMVCEVNGVPGPIEP